MDWGDELVDLKAKLEASQKALEEKDEKLLLAGEMGRVLCHDLEESQQKLKQAELDRDSSQHRVEEMEREVKESQKRIEKMKESLQLALRESDLVHQEELEKLKTKVKTFLKRLEVMRKSRDKEKAELDEALDSNTKLEAKVEQLQKHVSIIQKQKEIMEQKNEALENEKDENESELKSLLHTEVKSMKELKAKAFKKVTSLKEKIHDLKAERSSLSTKLQEAHLQHDRMVEELAQKQGENDVLRERIDALVKAVEPHEEIDANEILAQVESPEEGKVVLVAPVVSIANATPGSTVFDEMQERQKSNNGNESDASSAISDMSFMKENEAGVAKDDVLQLDTHWELARPDARRQCCVFKPAHFLHCWQNHSLAKKKMTRSSQPQRTRRF